ncbi:MAG: class I SAM-dependent methyltransferase [Candidatus Daviesbacteria bacterium]|nr:class I SAM-dependent methyltransferase [Candidatus Daviesbacteria bacterium]
MSYTIKVKDKKFMQHGQQVFDEQYYGMFFERYSYKEMLPYYRFFLGWIRFLDKFLPLKKGKDKKVLEIGCGIGAFAKILNERGFKVNATDVSPFIVERARQIHPSINFELLDIEKDIKTNRKYDYIFAFEVVEHLRSPVKALKNIKKILNNKGILIFSTPFPTKEMLADPMHINVHPSQFWLSLGEKIGYKSVEVKYVSFIPFLYKLHSFFSIALPFRIDSYFINSTGIYIFKK